MAHRTPNPRTQVEGELAEIRYTIRQREQYLARLQAVAPEQQRGLDRLRAIETRLVDVLQDLVAAHEIERAEQLRQGVG